MILATCEKTSSAPGGFQEVHPYHIELYNGSLVSSLRQCIRDLRNLQLAQILTSMSRLHQDERQLHNMHCILHLLPMLVFHLGWLWRSWGWWWVGQWWPWCQHLELHLGFHVLEARTLGWKFPCAWKEYSSRQRDRWKGWGDSYQCLWLTLKSFSSSLWNVFNFLKHLWK